MTVRIAPSILAADFARLADAVARVEAAGADLIHVDVMDGHFVPNITMGPRAVSALHRVTRLPLDVHLMIQDPDRYLSAFVDAGASMLTVHAEVLPHLHRTLSAIRDRGVQAGVALNPSTPVESMRDVARDIDHLVIMSVNPGFSGQPFIPHSIDKVVQARALLEAAGSGATVEVDGGVDSRNAGALAAAGAGILVAGSAVFDSPEPAAAIQALRQAAGAAV